MGLFDLSKRTSNQTTVNERNFSNTDNRVGGDNSIFGSNVTIGDGNVGANVTVTDFGAVNRAFDSFDEVVQSAETQTRNALKAVTDNTDKTTAALKEFATSLTVGDIQSSKWIAAGIIAAVMIVLIVYFVWGK